MPTRYRCVFVLVMATFAAALTAVEPPAQVPAFPGATGAGMFTTGGRGGQIVHVTNLNADGPGSLAEAVSQPNRIVVFDVSGVIDLAKEKDGEHRGGKITVTAPNITIAGQSAPGEGICLRGGALDVKASNVIVRYLRSRRGWNREGDTGDAITVEPDSIGAVAAARGESDAAFQKRIAKKATRGKYLHDHAAMANVIVDHCSTSWATDENLTVTHTDKTTVSWCIAAEGLDYANPRQTPPRHSEGSLWGSGVADGRATMHHVLYAHNRLRNPRTTGGDDTPAVQTFYNSVVYNWSEYASHTGSERVLLNWLSNYYQSGPDTPAAIRDHMFEFHGDREARIYARGNVIAGIANATADNGQAIFHNQKFKKVSPAERAAMIVDRPFGELPVDLVSAEQARDEVLADAGATLPARDMVDWRIVESVRTGGGRIIDRETDLPAAERWPDYRSLPLPRDTDRDGLPDDWEAQFGLDPQSPHDAKTLAGGYAHVEHYLNNSDPAGKNRPIVYVSAAVSRATVSQAAPGRAGVWRIARSGDCREMLTVELATSGDAQAGRDYEPLPSQVTIPAGKSSIELRLTPKAGARDNVTGVVHLTRQSGGALVGCPAQSLIVIRQQ